MLERSDHWQMLSVEWNQFPSSQSVPLLTSHVIMADPPFALQVSSPLFPPIT